jgi:hypothetical protein
VIRLSSLHAQGTYRSHCVLLALDSERLRDLLPTGLVPGAQTLTGPGRHPLLLMFGHHHGVRPSFLPVRGGTYHEFIAAIPFLDLEMPGGRRRGPFSFMSRLYLDNWLWVVMGWLYEYAKVRARVLSTPRSYAVRTLLSGRPIVSASFDSQGRTGPMKDFPHFDAIAPAFRQPFIAKIGFLPFLGSAMTFELEKATLQAIQGEVRIEDSFARGLPRGVFPFEGIDRDPIGAFFIEVPWTLSLPYLCRSRPLDEEGAQ